MSNLPDFVKSVNLVWPHARILKNVKILTVCQNFYFAKKHWQTGWVHVMINIYTYTYSETSWEFWKNEKDDFLNLLKFRKTAVTICIYIYKKKVRRYIYIYIHIHLSPSKLYKYIKNNGRTEFKNTKNIRNIWNMKVHENMKHKHNISKHI